MLFLEASHVPLVIGNHCLTPESGKRVQRSTAVSTSTTTHTHTPSEDVCYEPGILDTTEGHLDTESKCSLTQCALDVGDVLHPRCLPYAVVGSVFCPSLKCSNPSRQRFSRQSSSTRVVSRNPLESSGSCRALRNLIFCFYCV